MNFDFAELSGFDGLTTAAGYVFNSQLTANLDVDRISITPDPKPTSLALGLVAVLGGALKSRRRAK